MTMSVLQTYSKLWSYPITSKFIYLGLLLLLHGGQPVFLDNKETSSRISMTVANDGLVEGTVLVQSSINLHRITICCQHMQKPWFWDFSPFELLFGS